MREEESIVDNKLLSLIPIILTPLLDAMWIMDSPTRCEKDVGLYLIQIKIFDSLLQCFDTRGKEKTIGGDHNHPACCSQHICPKRF